MAIYDFKCPSCGTVEKDVILSMMHTDEEHPKCPPCDCYYEHYITKAPMGFVTDTEFPVPFKAGEKGEIISNKRQKEEFMARNGLYDANEVMSPPSPQEEAQTREEIRESIEAITPTAKQKEELKRVGLNDIVD